MAAGDVVRDRPEAVGRCAGLADRVDLATKGPPGLGPSARDVLAIRPYQQS